MDPKLILDSLLERSQQATAGGLDLAERKLGVENAEQRTAMLKGMGTGAAAAGALALLMGSKQGRKFSKKAVKVGGVAAIGGLAWKAYNDWSTQQQPATGVQAAPGGTPVVDRGTPIGELAVGAAQARSEVLIRAMIAASRIDGHIDDRERELIEERLRSLGLEQDFSRLLMAEMAEPVDAARIAGLSDSPETAAEIYLASAMVVDVETPEGHGYLDTLAASLGLNPNVRALLDAPLRDA
jgi:uncharacterized membrane protein YebE (DUF533 family)